MPSFDFIRQSKPEKTFRVASVIGKFDLPGNHIKERFTGEIEFPEDWQIGLIVGASGTGKTVISKELFPESYVTHFQYSSDAVINDMPESATVEQITKAFNSVGFSSPPSWLKPYSVLSGGQKMRVDLANAMLREGKMFVFDEFTSVVDRQVAKIGSFAMQKAIRRTKKKFIAVSCHSDVEQWLLPDWVFETNTMTFRKTDGQKKNRPGVEFEIYRTPNKGIWKMFCKHHYLSSEHNNAAAVYVAMINDSIAGFLSVLHFPHPIVKNMKKVHRLVILPDYQGLGFGVLFLNQVAKLYSDFRFSIVTSSPSLVFALKKHSEWRCLRFGRVKSQSKGTTVGNMNTSQQRITVSFEYIGTKHE